MSLLRETAFLLLALISSAVLALATDEINQTTIINNGTTDEVAGIPRCTPNYARMDPKNPKLIITALPYPAGICVGPRGNFVAAIWQVRAFVYLFNSCGWIIHRIELPTGTRHSASCAFVGNKLYYAATLSNKILQYNLRGTFEKEFTTGYRFLRLTGLGNRLYSSIDGTKQIRVYATYSGDLIRSFDVTSGNARGLAFDSYGYLHIAIWGKNVEIYNRDGQKIGKPITFPEVKIADGLTVDKNYNTVIADRSGRQVLVYDSRNKLKKRMVGFRAPFDVALGYDCAYLLVADYTLRRIVML